MFYTTAAQQEPFSDIFDKPIKQEVTVPAG
jgi:hypothetical protein